MGFIANGFYNLRFHGTINLYLHKTVLLITLNRCDGFIFRIRLDDSQCIWALTVDNTCLQDMRAYPASVINCFLNGFYITEFIAAIPYSGDPGREVCGPPLRLLEMRMHIPESWKN